MSTLKERYEELFDKAQWELSDVPICQQLCRDLMAELERVDKHYTRAEMEAELDKSAIGYSNLISPHAAEYICQLLAELERKDEALRFYARGNHITSDAYLNIQDTVLQGQIETGAVAQKALTPKEPV